MNEEIEKAFSQLKRASEKTEPLLKQLVRTSEILTSKSSSALFGTLGGLTGVMVAILFSNVFPISLFLLGVPLTAIGLTSGILIYRGTRRFRVERRIAENRLASDEILYMIKGLPNNAPDDVVEQLWQSFRELTVNHSNSITGVITTIQAPALPDPDKPRALSGNEEPNSEDPNSQNGTS